MACLGEDSSAVTAACLTHDAVLLAISGKDVKALPNRFLQEMREGYSKLCAQIKDAETNFKIQFLQRMELRHLRFV